MLCFRRMYLDDGFTGELSSSSPFSQGGTIFTGCCLIDEYLFEQLHIQSLMIFNVNEIY